MPGFDGTGPGGMGPMTGGGRGFCSPWGVGAAPRGYGVSPRMGYGYPYYTRVGVPYPFYGAPATAPGAMPSTSSMSLEQELSFLKSQLGQVESRIRELEAKEK